MELARYNIDMLETLVEKTKGNLTAEEDKVLKHTLNDLRMGFIQVMSTHRRAAARQRKQEARW